MRCPHCAGEILDGSRFCGICGGRLASATIPAATAAADQPEPSGRVRVTSSGKPRAELIPVSEAGVAPIELPISRGARWARILAVLALDLALAGAGVAMIVSFARDCEGVRSPAASPAPTASTAPAAGARAGAGAATSGEREMPEARP
jgi:hypothetical protein